MKSSFQESEGKYYRKSCTPCIEELLEMVKALHCLSRNSGSIVKSRINYFLCNCMLEIYVSKLFKSLTPSLTTQNFISWLENLKTSCVAKQEACTLLYNFEAIDR